MNNYGYVSKDKPWSHISPQGAGIEASEFLGITPSGPGKVVRLSNFNLPDGQTSSISF